MLRKRVAIKGKYHVESRIGGGGMAEVFVASAVGAEGVVRKVAIKRILPGYSTNASFAQMFVDEARITSQLSHPNIVGLLDFDRDESGNFFIVMELVQGCDLTRLGPLSFSAVAFVVSELLRGLGHAHAARVIHRDVSPHNVLVSRDGAVKLSDFGIAKVRAQTTATASVFVKGKPAYMSPEQANNAPIDARSDLFAVGIIMWELLTGQRLFAADDVRASLAKIMFGTIPRPRSIRADIPKTLERVTMKLVERDPAARYQDAAAAIRELEPLAVGGREALNAALAAAFSGQSTKTPTVIAATPVLPRRRRWIWLVAAGSLAAAGGVVAIASKTSETHEVAVVRDAAATPSKPEPTRTAVVPVAKKSEPVPGLTPNGDRRLMTVDLDNVMPRCGEYSSNLAGLSRCSTRSATERSDFQTKLARLRDELVKLTAGEVRDEEAKCEQETRELALHLGVCSDGISPDKLDLSTLGGPCTDLLAAMSRLAGCSRQTIADKYSATLTETKRRLVWFQERGIDVDDGCKRVAVELPSLRASGCR